MTLVNSNLLMIDNLVNSRVFLTIDEDVKSYPKDK